MSVTTVTRQLSWVREGEVISERVKTMWDKKQWAANKHFEKLHKRHFYNLKKGLKLAKEF